jgi:hypothetical protein
MLGFTAIVVALLGGLLFGIGSLLAIDVAAPSVLERRARGAKLPLIGWTSVFVAVAGAGFFAWFWYSYNWGRFHHPGGGGPVEPSTDILTVMLLASAAVGLLGLLVVVARYGPDRSSGCLTSG